MNHDWIRWARLCALCIVALGSVTLLVLTTTGASDSKLLMTGKPTQETFTREIQGYGALSSTGNQVAVYVSAQGTRSIRPGMAAKVTLSKEGESPATIQGRVLSVLRDADPNTRQSIVTLQIPPSRFPPRTYAVARIILDSHTGMAVPSTAIVVDGGKSFVYRKSGADQFERVEVQVGVRRPNFIEIRGGIRPSEEILIAGALEWAQKGSSEGGGD